VIEVPRSLALDAEMVSEVQSGDAMLERAELVARDYGLKVEGDLVQAREAGHAIVDEAIERGVDVIVIGVDYDRPYGRFALGSLSDYLLEHAPGQVWVIRGHHSGEGGSLR
jgi:nucleotide-binding universal stress UspA family protein